MATKKLEEFQIKTAEEIAQDIVNSKKASYLKRGKEILVAPGSQYYIDANDLAQQIYAASQSFELKAADMMPDTAVGDALYRQAAIRGLSLRAAGPSTGQIIFDCSIATPIGVAQGVILSDTSGATYEVSIGGLFSDGDLIDIDSIDTGTSTNLAEGEVLRWASPPSFANSTATVGVGGLIGGVDSETDENLRGRLLDRIQHPPGGGNWSQLALAAEESASAVQKAFVYMACNGPSTVHVAVCGAPTQTNKSRQMNNLIITSKVTPGILEVMPEFAELVVTNVVDYPASVSVGLSLPDATTASIPGPGGGWTDAQPFPVPDYSANTFCGAIYINSTEIIIQSTLPPVAGTSRVVWINKADWTVHKTVIDSFTTAGVGLYDCILHDPFAGLVSGDWIFPDAENIETYIDALLTSFSNLGPGQKTNSTNLLPKAYRRPLVNQSWSSSISPSILKFIENTGDEVLDVQYLYKSINSAPVAPSITSGPFILIPLQIGFYPNEIT
jgi:hypothetical protein